MKLLPKQQPVNTEDSIGLGIEAAVIVALFFGVGFGLDRLFGTTPVLMIVMTLIGAVGLFAKFKYRYDDRMNELEALRSSRAAPRDAGRTAGSDLPTDREVV